jgi:hypothetical protein
MKKLHFFKASRYVEFPATKCNIPGDKKPHNLFYIQYDMNIASLAAVLEHTILSVSQQTYQYR